MLRINESLFHLIEHIRDGGGVEEFIQSNPVMNSENILKVLLMLVNGGYLTLERVEAKDFPSVSVIIPVRDNPEDLQECIHTLENLRYPKDKLEIIVVDDGSKQDVSQIIKSSRVRVIRNETSQGPAACRNVGAGIARGDIFAFLDADCIAAENWLAETVPFFRAVNAGAVGGYVDGYYNKTSLDRYEKAFSSLSMGKHLIMEAKSTSAFYVPTANLLVSRDAFKAAGGFDEKMHIGEDVDFCWRLRDLGNTLIYTPFGRVAHKHRNHLGAMLKRRAEYGSSEALLYGGHRDKKKSFSISVFYALSFLALCFSILLLNPYPLALLPLLFIIDFSTRYFSKKPYLIPRSFRQKAASILRSYFSFFYYAFFHVTRYYLVLFILFGFLWYPLWILGGLGILWASGVDYAVKKPGLFYPVFLYYYILEHLVYQIGVLAGCFKYRYFGSYVLSFKKA
jgi:mycofactocin system glycosyltransferase